MLGTDPNTEAFYMLLFSPLRMSFHWPLTSIVSDEKSGVILILIFLDVMLSPATFITLSLVSYNDSVSLQSVVVIVVYFICLYLFFFEFTEILNLCVDVSIKFEKSF